MVNRRIHYLMVLEQSKLFASVVNEGDMFIFDDDVLCLVLKLFEVIVDFTLPKAFNPPETSKAI